MKKILLLSVLGFMACKKTIEIVEVPVETRKSWLEVQGFNGVGRIFLSSGGSSDAIYLQQPYFFTAYKNNKITQYGAALPTDLDIRIPISGAFSAVPALDSILRVFNNNHPITSPTGGYYNLKYLDPSIKAIEKRFLGDVFKIMAISTNGVLLFAYRTDKPQFNLMLMKIKTSVDYPYVDTVSTQKISIEKVGISSYIRQIASVEDYFFVEIPSQGLYKIREDGSVKKTESLMIIDALYEWQGKTYGHAEWGTVYISDNEGDSWQAFEGIPTFMTISQFYTVKDSLVGVSRDNIYTLKWDNAQFTTRFLKNDGLENTKINGLEVLNDSVYVATTAGLFVKPLSTFFEGK